MSPLLSLRVSGTWCRQAGEGLLTAELHGGGHTTLGLLLFPTKTLLEVLAVNEYPSTPMCCSTSHVSGTAETIRLQWLEAEHDGPQAKYPSLWGLTSLTMHVLEVHGA